MASERWPYDESTRALIAQRLYALLPALYRVQDEPPRGREELRRFLEVLAGPLAVVRQNIEELHVDLFIDTASDEALSLLADMVGTRLLFPNADANRRDVRGTVAWRRRKGTPAMLQEMAEELAEQLVVLMEGWKHVAVTQDLDLLRPERVLPDVRSPLLSETSTGPLDATHHAVDVRAVSWTTGRYHPRHVTHWLHPTRMFPVERGTAAYVGDHGDPTASNNPGGMDPDWRYAVHPLGRSQALRVRRASTRDDIPTDRVPPMHFDAAPGDWFGKEGRFAIRVAGLLAGVAEPSTDVREPQTLLAHPAVADGAATLQVLEHETQRLTTPVELALCSVPLTGALLPDTAGASVRAVVQLHASGPAHPIPGGSPPALVPGAVVMLRLKPVGSPGAYFPGATVLLTGGTEEARRAHPVLGMQRSGFLRGALVVKLPAGWVMGERWLYVGADGSVVQAQTQPQGPVNVPLVSTSDGPRLDSNAVTHVGPGPVWPPLPLTAEVDLTDWLPPSQGSGPVILHGGRALREAAGVTQGVANTTEVSMVFSAGFVDAGVVRYRPMVRLRWTGPEAASASWRALDDDGADVGTASDARLAALAAWRDGDRPPRLRLAVRLEASAAGVILPPCEVAWTNREGEALLIHLPELTTVSGGGPVTWKTQAPYTAMSDAVAVAVDGSTWWEAGGNARMATSGPPGQPCYRGVAPLSRPVMHLRRRVRWRSLCQWSREAAAGLKHAGTRTGFLDVDVGHGLFAFANSDAPQLMPLGPRGAPRPPNVTVDYQEGYTAHVGARATTREPELNLLQETPTRIVSRGGTLRRGAPTSLGLVPCYRSLTEALAAIAIAPAEKEVIEFQDSATYPDEAPVWPAGVKQLTLQAAERYRPVLRVSGWSAQSGTGGGPAPTDASGTIVGGPPYDVLTLRGLVFSGPDVKLPRAYRVDVQYCSVADAGATLRFSAPGEQFARVTVIRSILAGVHLVGVVDLILVDSVVDAGAGVLPRPVAIHAADGRLFADRATVTGTVRVRELEASEVLFTDVVEVTDQFRGCIRFSSVPEGCVLPRRHQVVQGRAARFVSVSRDDPAHVRLAEHCDGAILSGAADGSEIGVFQGVQTARRREALLRRLDEFTPAGLVTGVIRVD
ncbi:hypothetical protein HPC49_12790 [Pyxidicoccus fallax]|uniref:Uncharacterized protein n=1 Tax=Pyxidicoccus fallax TaxID=394095 RepID=A0A848LA16_9BACT|nr:hypothetical protein [Pyxidicoccus fallax]NMO15417.1 hypothetical protein [Pyxidicoccus fallax]NPC79112.1 hypothetical protein [Pyxidicoccus fallax]